MWDRWGDIVIYAIIAVVVLLIVFLGGYVFDFFLGLIEKYFLLFYKNKNIAGINWISSFTSFGLGLLGYIIFRRISQKYDPQGYEKSTTHQWEFTHDKHKLRDATIKESYEAIHGIGSWYNKTEGERKSIIPGGFFIVLILSVFLISFKESLSVERKIIDVFIACLTYIVCHFLAAFMDYCYSFEYYASNYKEYFLASLNAVLSVISGLFCILFAFSLTWFIFDKSLSAYPNIYLAAQSVVFIGITLFLLLLPLISFWEYLKKS